MEDYTIHVRTSNEETYQNVVDALRPLGVEIVAGESDPLVMALFYLSRISTKGDNLGQLRHLFDLVKIGKRVAASADVQKEYYADLLEERKLRQAANFRLFLQLQKQFGKRENTNIKLVGYMTPDEIQNLFVDDTTGSNA